MPDNEKVIKELEWSLKTACVKGRGSGKEIGVIVPQDTVSNALALLKARARVRGPRVMTYDELATFNGAFFIESSAISLLDWSDCVFFFDIDTESDAVWVENFDGERSVIYREDYGTYVRCWTSRPTDEQREATPWK